MKEPTMTEIERETEKFLDENVPVEEHMAMRPVLIDMLTRISRPKDVSPTPRAWVVECPKGHEYDFMVFSCEGDAEDQAELFNDDYPEGENPHAAVPLYKGTSRPPAGFVRDDAGVDRRVLGTLPVTADGCVAGDGARIIFPQPDGSLNYEHVCTRGVLGPIQSGFSTPAAAEAAAEKERGQ